MNSSSPTLSPRPLIAPGVAHPERLRRTHSHEAKSFKIIESIQALSCREDTLGTLENQAVSEEQQAEEDWQMRAKRTGKVSWATSWNAIADIIDLIEDAVTASATQEGENGISRTDYRLEAIFRGVIDKAIDNQSRSVEFERHLIWTIKDVTLSPQQVTGMKPC